MGSQCYQQNPYILLSYLTQSAKTSAPLEEAINTLSWVHYMATVEDVTVHTLVQQVLAGAKRMLVYKISKEEPITTVNLLALVNRFGSKDASSADIRVLTFCLLGYAGFFLLSPSNRSTKTRGSGGNHTYWY